MNRCLCLSLGRLRPLIGLLLPALCLSAWLLHEPEGLPSAEQAPSLSPPPSSQQKARADGEPAPAPIVLCDVHEASPSGSALDETWLALFEAKPSAAIAAAEQLEEPLRSELRLALYERLGRFPAQALAELGRLHTLVTDSGEDLSSIIECSLIREGALTEALEAARLAPEGKAREWLPLVCTAWATREPAQAPRLEALLLRQGCDEETLQRFHKAWGAADPAALLSHAATLPEGAARSSARRSGLEAWLAHAPAEATLEALRSAISDTAFDEALHAYIMRGDSLSRPSAQALSLAAGIGDPALREQSLSKALSEYAAEDRTGALDFLKLLPASDEKLRSRLLATLEHPPVSP